MSKSFIPPKSSSPAKPAPTIGYLDRRSSATYLSISTRLLDDLAGQGLIPRIKIGRKTLFRVSDLDAFFESKIQESRED